MIELYPTTALMLYLFLCLGGVLFLWWRSHLKARSKKVLPPREELQVCEYCRFAYLSEGDKPVSRCPQCDQLNSSCSQS